MMEQPYSSEKLNIEALEAALTDYIERNPFTDEDQAEQAGWFKDAVARSPWLQASIVGFVKFFRAPLRDEAVKRMEEDRGDAISDVELESSRVMTVAAQFFFIGWHARGAVEDQERLRRMTEGGMQP